MQENKAPSEYVALRECVRRGDFEGFKKLFPADQKEAKRIANERDPDGHPLLHQVIGFSNITKAKNQEAVHQCVKFLLDVRADVNAISYNSHDNFLRPVYSSPWRAVSNLDVRLVELLLEEGADVTQKTSVAGFLTPQGAHCFLGSYGSPHNILSLMTVNLRGIGSYFLTSAPDRDMLFYHITLLLLAAGAKGASFEEIASDISLAPGEAEPQESNIALINHVTAEGKRRATESAPGVKSCVLEVLSKVAVLEKMVWDYVDWESKCTQDYAKQLLDERMEDLNKKAKLPRTSADALSDVVCSSLFGSRPGGSSVNKKRKAEAPEIESSNVNSSNKRPDLG